MSLLVKFLPSTLLAQLALIAPGHAQVDDCRPRWLPTFGGHHGVYRYSGEFVFAETEFDDGSGPALYVAGLFETAGGVLANNVASWNGKRWAALGGGVDGRVDALAVFDDGGGPALYAGGYFTNASGVAANHIAKWDGESWSPLGSGMNGPVNALAVFDDGSGPRLYAGSNGAPHYIARWSGTSWSPVGGGMNDSVQALRVFDDGDGAALYAGGEFTTAGGVAASRMARWNGASWAALGTGTNNSVLALEVFDDGNGPALYAGGSFVIAGGVATRVARWDGSTWSGITGSDFGIVEALTVLDDGSGPALYAGGVFASVNGVTVNSIARWDGTSWFALGSGVPGGSGYRVYALTAFDDGTGPALYAGGEFGSIGGETVLSIGKWNSSSWSALGGRGMNSPVSAVAGFDDGNGPALYAGGDFTTVDGVTVNGIARRDGSGWSPLGTGMGGAPSWVNHLAVFDDGSGPALHAAGYFTSAGGVPANGLARWDGTSWSALGGGPSGGFLECLAVLDDGSGPALYAGASTVWKWNGSTWSTLPLGPDDVVHDLEVFDDGSGPALYAVGYRDSGTCPCDTVLTVKWTGSTWEWLGSGIGETFDGASAYAAAVFDDGSGPALYVGGSFQDPLDDIVRWDGTSWSAVGGGLTGAVYDLQVFDDGSGPALYAAGWFGTTEGASYIAKWDGTSWSALGSGLSDSPRTLTVYDDGNGPALVAAGEFASAIDSGDSFVARWGCPFPVLHDRVRKR